MAATDEAKKLHEQEMNIMDQMIKRTGYEANEREELIRKLEKLNEQHLTEIETLTKSYR